MPKTEKHALHMKLCHFDCPIRNIHCPRWDQKFFFQAILVQNVSLRHKFSRCHSAAEDLLDIQMAFFAASAHGLFVWSFFDFGNHKFTVEKKRSADDVSICAFSKRNVSDTMRNASTCM
jgi:hypothetical protein